MNRPTKTKIGAAWRWLARLVRFFVWRGEWGICLFGPSSFARYDDDGSCYGPYTLWFERKLWPVYRAVTPPKEAHGITTL